MEDFFLHIHAETKIIKLHSDKHHPDKFVIRSDLIRRKS